MYTSSRKNDPAGNEIARLRLPIGRAPRVILGKDPDDIEIDEQSSPLDTGIELTPTEYDQFVRLSGNELKIDGKGLYEKLNEVVTSDERYTSASDALKGTIITRMVLAYRKAATAELLKENEGLMEIYRERISGKARALTAPSGAPRAIGPGVAP